jgi:hypothetical protein
MSGIEIIGLALAVAGGIDLLIKAGKSLQKRLSELENAQTLANDLSVFGVESARQQLKLRLEIGASIMNDPRVEDDVKDILDKTFQAIQKAIIEANAQLDDINKKKKRGPLYLLVERRSMQALENNTRNLKQLSKDFLDTVQLVRSAESGNSSAKLPRDSFRVSSNIEATISDTISIVKCHLAHQFGRIEPKAGAFLLEHRSKDNRAP